MFLSGVPFFVDDNLGVTRNRIQVRFPRSKKRRIRKKWAKQSKNFTEVVSIEPVCFKAPGYMIVNSKMLAMLRAKGGF